MRTAVQSGPFPSDSIEMPTCPRSASSRSTAAERSRTIRIQLSCACAVASLTSAVIISPGILETASAAVVEMPPAAAASAPAAPPPPVAAPAATAASPRSALEPTARGKLRIGAFGPLVRDLQRELRRRGIRIAVDGSFGPATKRAVRRMQRRLRLRPTGVADSRLLRRLGLWERAAASGPSRTAGTGAGRAGTGAGRYVKAFPVSGEHAYSNDWGAPRNQGSHEGTDIMADRHTPLIAADSGVISKMSRTESGLGGIYLWIRRDDGIQFYYAHMQSIAQGLEVGTRVALGQVVGTVGNSGDARYGATHVHFEVRREWTSFNPYPELVKVDPDHAGA